MNEARYSRFTTPAWLKSHLYEFNSIEEIPQSLIDSLKNKLSKFHSEEPEVSVVMPVWNEGMNLFKTLSTFAEQQTSKKVELLIVNNNSTDNTQQIIDLLGVKNIFVEGQGISNARQAGLDTSKGLYILNADGDSFYPPKWIETMSDKLGKDGLVLNYGRHSFIPPEGSSRFVLGCYEILAETVFNVRNRNRQYLNVLGFNFAFLKSAALQVGGFNTARKKWSDGWMAMSLMDIGKISLIRSYEARVWTSPRRLMADGSLAKAFRRRAKKELSNLYEYIFKTPIKK